MRPSSNIFGPRIGGSLVEQLSELIDQLHIDQVNPPLVLARLLVVLRDAAASKDEEKQSVNARARGDRLGRQKSVSYRRRSKSGA
jgi:hypothetical protein